MQQFGALDETYTTFPHISSLTRTDCRNSKLFKKIQFEKDIHVFFQYFRKSSRKQKSEVHILERRHPSINSSVEEGLRKL